MKSHPELSYDTFQYPWVTWLQTRPVIYQAEKDATTLCIQFEEGGLFALTKIPETEFKDTMVAAVRGDQRHSRSVGKPYKHGRSLYAFVSVMPGVSVSQPNPSKGI